MKEICKSRIAILLATYNGEKYLQQQIDSLMSQSFKDWTLYICDDGSTDRTLEIIKINVIKYSNIIHLPKRHNTQGACLNFLNMLRLVSASYYMFCDQDDVWLPFKIELCFKSLKQVEERFPNKPICVCSDLMLVDSNLHELYPSMWKYSKLRPQYLSKWKYLRTCNILTGCTMLFNQAARDISIISYNNALMHDSWIGLQVSSKGGKIICVDKPTILYRQHNSNVLGAPHDVNCYYYYQKLRNILEIFYNIRKQLKYLNKIKNTSFVSFIWYKLLYSFLRLYDDKY